MNELDIEETINPPSEEKFTRSESIPPGRDGWLSPSGVFFEADKTQHDELADWIIKNNLSELRPNIWGPKSDRYFFEKSSLPQRQFLNDKGWILINGPIFHTDNVLNYSTIQLTKLAEAKIPIVGAYDGSKEFSTQETLEWVEKATKDISDLIEKQGNKILTWTPLDYQRIKKVNQSEFWEEIGNRGYSTLEDFKKNPFHTEFADFGLVPFEEVRDVLTQGYEDEIVFDRSLDTYTLRLLKLNSGERICVEYIFHHHDRDSGNDEHMNIYVVDDFTFKEKVEKYISSGISPQIKGEYFKRLIEAK